MLSCIWLKITGFGYNFFSQQTQMIAFASNINLKNVLNQVQ